MKWVAAADSLDRQPSALDKSVLLYRLIAVYGAGRGEATTRRHHARYRQLIEPDKQQCDVLHVRRNSRSQDAQF